MAFTAKKKQRDPNTPIQILSTKKGAVRVNGKFWMVGGKDEVPRIIILTPEGGYRYARGGPIRSEKDLELLPEPERTKALEWWANKDLWQETAPRKIAFEQGTGYPIFEDTGEYVDDPGVLQAYWPEGPILFAAMHALGNRLDAKVTQPMGLKVVEGLAPVPEMVESESPKKAHGNKGSGWTPERLAKARATKEANRAAQTAKAPQTEAVAITE